LNQKTIFETLETEFNALELIFEVGFVFFGVFWLDLAKNKERCQR
jgi:hypothetical protein